MAAEVSQPATAAELLAAGRGGGSGKQPSEQQAGYGALTGVSQSRAARAVGGVGPYATAVAGAEPGEEAAAAHAEAHADARAAEAAAAREARQALTAGTVDPSGLLS